MRTGAVTSIKYLCCGGESCECGREELNSRYKPKLLSVDYWHQKEAERAEFEHHDGFLSGFVVGLFSGGGIAIVSLIIAMRLAP